MPGEPGCRGAWAQASKERQAESYTARVVSETLLSRLRRGRARPAPVRPVAGAGAWVLEPPRGAGIMGYSRAIFRILNNSYSGHLS